MIAIDIGGSHISSLVVTDVLKGIVQGSLRNNSFDGRRSSKDEILDVWTENISQTIRSVDFFDGNLAIAIPGPFDYQSGVFDAHPRGKFSSLIGVNIKEELHERIPTCRNIYFDNDAACFGIGEYYYGQDQKYSKVLAITLGTGVGSAFIHQGHIIRTSENVPLGGEVYHLPFKGQTADDFFSTRWFVKESEQYGLLVSGVKELILSEDILILENVFDRFSHNFISFFTPIAENFQANSIVVGGNISKAWDHFGNQISFHFNKLGIDMVRSEMGEKIICLGAARSMYNQLSL